MAKKATTPAVKETKKDEKALAVVSAPLTSASMALHATYDTAQFEGVGLDLIDNKEIFSNDILIPKVWVTQGQSEHRKTHEIKEGTFVDSQSLEVIAGVGGPLKFIVLKTFKRWHTFEIVIDPKNKLPKKEFKSSEIMVWGKNHDLKYQETIDGKDIVRRQVISAYVLLEKDAILGINKPYIIDFASSSKGAGRILVSDIATLNKAKFPSFVGFFEMTAVEESFDLGSAWVKVVKFGGYCPKETMPYLIDAYKSLASIENQIVIDDSDVIKGDVEAVEVETNVGKKASVASAKI